MIIHSLFSPSLSLSCVPASLLLCLCLSASLPFCLYLERHLQIPRRPPSGKISHTSLFHLSRPCVSPAPPLSSLSWSCSALLLRPACPPSSLSCLGVTCRSCSCLLHGCGTDIIRGLSIVLSLLQLVIGSLYSFSPARRAPSLSHLHTSDPFRRYWVYQKVITSPTWISTCNPTIIFYSSRCISARVRTSHR